ncbi:flagellar basal-body rod protein FlgF [Vreelandella utahensis]|uniref:flagellar basal-body rod protein FlgF n=1 Tax=Vreelandella halophila TaxID=86177 RepID=UPI0009878CE9|nr:flagellar basal-body rod protein FlgF [Halomonas utahensis]
MDRSLYISMTGAKQNMYAQQVNANNLANADTTGFKQDFANARSMPVYGEHHPSRAYAMTENPGADLSHGPMKQTGRSLDIAIKGDGWLAVEPEPGDEAYTRAGSLQVDANGILRNGEGLPVMGNGGPVAVPPADKIEIGSDGTLSVVPAGAPSDQLVEVDRLKLVNPDQDEIEKGEDGLFRLKEGADQEGPLQPDADVQVVSGFLEGSNVSAVESMIQNLQLSRQYEMQVKAMQTADENSQSVARLLQDL